MIHYESQYTPISWTVQQYKQVLTFVYPPIRVLQHSCLWGDVSANTMDIILSLACKLIEQLILVKTHGQLNDIKNIHCLITARQQEILSSQKPFVSWSHESFKQLKKITDFNIPSILSFMWKTIEKMVYKNSIQRMVIEVWD